MALSHAEAIRRIIHNEGRHMSTKHFRLIALAVHEAKLPEAECLRVAAHLSAAFERFTAFNRVRFEKACMTGTWDHTAGSKSAA